MKIISLPNNGDDPIVISTFYKFCNIDQLELFRDKLHAFCCDNSIFGTALLGSEGINATLSAMRSDMDRLYDFFSRYPQLQDLEVKETFFRKHPFGKLKVRIKNEIVTLREGNVEYNPGVYVSAKEWDEFIKRDDVILIDTRNDYEYYIGTFNGAINPDTSSFREFGEWCKKNLPDKNAHIAGFCTGGVRCEKSTSWLKAQGYNNVYHLQGGIIGYFLETKNSNSAWHGDCFVFDDRVVIDDHAKAR